MDREYEILKGITEISADNKHIKEKVNDISQRIDKAEGKFDELKDLQNDNKYKIDILTGKINTVDEKADKLQHDLTAHDIKDQQTVWGKPIKVFFGMNLMQASISLMLAGLLVIVVLWGFTTFLGKDHTADIMKTGIGTSEKIIIQKNEK